MCMTGESPVDCLKDREVYMTVSEFWNLVDAIDIDSREDGRYTEDEMYSIGNAFIEMNNAQKREVGGWDKLVEILHPLDKNGDAMTKGDTFRQWIKNRRYSKDEMIHNDRMISGQNIDGISFEEFQQKTEEIKQNLYKQQVKTRDTLNAYRRSLREEARLEDFKDLMKSCVVDINSLPEVEYAGDAEPGSEAVLMLSDFHIGVEIDNYYNKYNVTIARKRINKLVQDVIRYCICNSVETLHVLGLGDFCQGLIHTSARLEQEIDVVQQIMLASEILADALNKLQAAAPVIKYYSVTDNHTRAIASLSESIESENYGKLITFYLKARLENTGIEFVDSILDQEIGLIEFNNGKTGVFAHGHHDRINSMFQNMTAFTGKMIDYAFIGHYHCEKVKTFNNFKVFVNGSVVGLDQFAFSKRLFGKPSQTLIIFDGTNIINHSIDLDIQ